ncbi:hypothetical protein GCM10014715_56890 [Streptomyces spiralis]|uniref:Secreted protein n=1 Tax=Streptomyces spiralis TaxID=66376 RepID=A0A919DYB2_9ACTN|nr:hypothetical protein GCM10014715_56890 [Streptomyces spiralis]
MTTTHISRTWHLLVLAASTALVAGGALLPASAFAATTTPHTGTATTMAAHDGHGDHGKGDKGDTDSYPYPEWQPNSYYTDSYPGWPPCPPGNYC